MSKIRRCTRHARDGGGMSIPKKIQGHRTVEQGLGMGEEVVRLPGARLPECTDHQRDERKDVRLELEGREARFSDADTEGEELAFLSHLSDPGRIQAGE